MTAYWARRNSRKSLFEVIAQGDTAHGEWHAGVAKGWLPCISRQEVETMRKCQGNSREKEESCSSMSSSWYS